MLLPRMFFQQLVTNDIWRFAPETAISVEGNRVNKAGQYFEYLRCRVAFQARWIFVSLTSCLSIAGLATLFWGSEAIAQGVYTLPRPTAHLRAAELPHHQVEEARRLNKEGIELSAQKLHEQSAEAYRKAYLLFPHPDVLRNLALSYYAYGEFQDALQLLLSYNVAKKSERDALIDKYGGLDNLRANPEAEAIHKEMSEDIFKADFFLEQCRDKLRAMGTMMALVIRPPNAQVSLYELTADGQAVSLFAEFPAVIESEEREIWVQPGKYRMVVSAQGWADRSVDVQLEPAVAYRRTVELSDTATPARAPLGQLEVTCNIANAEVNLSGKPIGTVPIVAQMIGPGTHAIRVTAPGFVEFEDEVQILDGKTTSLHVTLAPDAAARFESSVRVSDGPDDRWTQAHTGWTLVGVGAGAAIAGGILYALALNKVDNANEQADKSVYDDAKGQWIGSLVGFGVGGAAAIAGLTMILLDQESQSPSGSVLGVSATPIQNGGMLQYEWSFR